MARHPAQRGADDRRGDRRGGVLVRRAAADCPGAAGNPGRGRAHGRAVRALGQEQEVRKRQGLFQRAGHGHGEEGARVARGAHLRLRGRGVEDAGHRRSRNDVYDRHGAGEPA